MPLFSVQLYVCFWRYHRSTEVPRVPEDFEASDISASGPQQQPCHYAAYGRVGHDGGGNIGDETSRPRRHTHTQQLTETPWRLRTQVSQVTE